MAKATGGRTIPVGAETAIKNWYLGQYFDKEPQQHGSKYTLKGIESEWYAVNELSRYHGEYYEKNTTLFQDTHLAGTPDIITDSEVIDIKCPFDCFTFPLFEELDKRYWWQMQGYMELTGKTKARVIFILLDPPEQVIEMEARHIARAENTIVTEELIEATRLRLSYEHLPIEKRIKEFTVEKDPDAITAIRERVDAMRSLINEKISSL